MRILLFTEFFPKSQSGEITGGVEARCFYLASHLAPRHHVDVLANKTDGALWDHASAASLPRRVAFLLRGIRDGLGLDFDVVEGSNLVVYPAAWLLGTLRRKPVVLWVPDVLLGSWVHSVGRIGIMGEIVERALLRLPVARYVTCARRTVAKLTAAGVGESKVSVVPCGFEPGLVTQARQDAGRPVHDIVVVSRFVGYKRVDVVLRAVARLAARRQGIRVLIVGRGPEEERLHALTAELGIEANVEFAGFVPVHLDVLRHVARSRVFVSASELEGFGIVLVEAMALGVPYVVSDIDTFHEVSGAGTGGLLFRPGDAEDLALKLGSLLGDDELRARKSEEGLDFAQRYTWEQVSRSTERVFEEVVAGRSGRAHRG